jgi:hypothetical protein
MVYPRDGNEENMLETHHIVPRCMGGTDDPSNLVRLTFEEHVEAHHILHVLNRDNLSLKKAYYMMANIASDSEARRMVQSYAGKRGAAVTNEIYKNDKEAAKVRGQAGNQARTEWRKNNAEIFSEIQRNFGIRGGQATAKIEWKCSCGKVSTPGGLGKHLKKETTHKRIE